MKIEMVQHKTRLRMTPLAACLALALAAADTNLAADAMGRTAAAQPHAITVPVTDCGDAADDPGTLRNVIAANFAIEGVTVDLSQLACSTITLTQGAIPISAFQDNLTLQGPGQDALTIDGANADRVFRSDGVPAPGEALRINDLTIAHGSYEVAHSSVGGCIYARRNLALSHVTVTGCTAHSTSLFDEAQGGGIYSFGSITLTGSTISGNTAQGPTAVGGGIAWRDQTFRQGLTATDSTISGNRAIGDSTHGGASGGGIMGGFGRATLTRCTIGGNTASTTSNAATVLGADGGGVDADVTLMNSVVTDNVASSAGAQARALGGGMLFSSAEITASTISGNSASAAIAAGGGLYASFGGQVTITNTTIDGNASSGSGGGAYLGGGTLVNSTISGNQAGTVGGGIHSGITPLTLRNSTIASNRAQQSGGGAYLYASVQTTMQSTIVAANVSGGDASSADLGSSGSVAIDGANDLIGSAGAAIALPAGTLHGDPQLLPLAGNGGLTRTHALAPTSPAIDTGNNVAGVGFDQRGDGFPRIAGGGPDIGAFESQNPEDGDRIFRNGFDP